MAYKFQIGAAKVSGSLQRDAGDITVRTHAGLAAAKLSILGEVSGSGIANFGSIKLDSTEIVSPARQLKSIASLDTITENTIEAAIDTLANLTSYGSDGVETRALGSLDVVGGIQINNVSFADASRNVAAGTVTATGLASLDGGIDTNSDFTVDVDGNVVGVAGTFSALASLDGGVNINDKLSISTAGALSGAFGSSATLANGRFAVSATGVLSGSGAGGAGQIKIDPDMFITGGFGSSLALADAKFTVSNAGVVVAAGSVTGAGLASTSTVSGSGALSAGGTVRFDGVADDTVAVAADSFYFLDNGSKLMKKQAIGNVVAALAGAGLVETSDQFAVSLGSNGGLVILGDSVEISGSNILAGTAAVATEEMLFLNSDGTLAKESFVDYAAAIAGAGLSASGGVLSTQAGTVTPIADLGTLAEGYNYLTGTAGGSYKLPIDASVGDVVHLKNGAGGVATLTRQSNHTIDGLNSIVLESSRGAVSMVYAVTSSWFLV